MIKLSCAVVVEGKYDKMRLSNVIDAPIIETNGFAIFKDKEKLELIRAFAATTGIIILTDSDRAGLKIRNHIKNCIQGGKVLNIYIPDIFGKEKRKDKPSKEGKLGVEGIPEEILANAFKNAGIDTSSPTALTPVTREMLFDDGLIGGASSSEKRKALQKKLGLPEIMGTNALLEVLNAIIGAEKYKETIKEIS